MIQPTIDPTALAAATDEALMKAITKREQLALNELAGRYGKMLKAVVTHVVHEEAEADDVLQEIFLQIWKEAGNYSPRAGKPLGWVVTLARRRAIDRLRRRQAYGRAKDRFEEHSQQQPNDWVRNGIDAELIRSDLHRFLHRQMEALPEHQREAIELSYFKGLS